MRINIQIKTIDTDNVQLTLKDSVRVSKLKDAITKEIAIPVEAQRLFFMGKELEDCKKLKNYKLQNGIVHLFPKIPSDQLPLISDDEMSSEGSYEMESDNESYDDSNNMVNNPLVRNIERTVITVNSMVFNRVLQEMVEIDGMPMLQINIELPYAMNRDDHNHLISSVSLFILQSVGHRLVDINSLPFETRLYRRVLAFMQIKGRRSSEDEMTVLAAYQPVGGYVSPEAFDEQQNNTERNIAGESMDTQIDSNDLDMKSSEVRLCGLFGNTSHLFRIKDLFSRFFSRFSLCLMKCH